MPGVRLTDAQDGLPLISDAVTVGDAPYDSDRLVPQRAQAGEHRTGSVNADAEKMSVTLRNRGV